MLMPTALQRGAKQHGNKESVVASLWKASAAESRLGKHVLT